ncbi:MAG: hypothetical protein PHZ03_04085 [Syntrophomonas sp.]|nr:hypothetical protein [Syntrophomonas sp.]
MSRQRCESGVYHIVLRFHLLVREKRGCDIEILMDGKPIGKLQGMEKENVMQYLEQSKRVKG